MKFKRYASEKSALAAIRKQGLHGLKYYFLQPDDAEGGVLPVLQVELREDLIEVQSRGFKAELIKSEEA